MSIEMHIRRNSLPGLSLAGWCWVLCVLLVLGGCDAPSCDPAVQACGTPAATATLLPTYTPYPSPTFIPTSTPSPVIPTATSTPIYYDLLAGCLDADFDFAIAQTTSVEQILVTRGTGNQSGLTSQFALTNTGKCLLINSRIITVGVASGGGLVPQLPKDLNPGRTLQLAYTWPPLRAGYHTVTLSLVFDDVYGQPRHLSDHDLTLAVNLNIVTPTPRPTLPPTSIPSSTSPLVPPTSPPQPTDPGATEAPTSPPQPTNPPPTEVPTTLPPTEAPTTPPPTTEPSPPTVTPAPP